MEQEKERLAEFVRRQLSEGERIAAILEGIERPPTTLELALGFAFALLGGSVGPTESLVLTSRSLYRVGWHWFRRSIVGKYDLKDVRLLELHMPEPGGGLLIPRGVLRLSVTGDTELRYFPKAETNDDARTFVGALQATATE